MIKTRRNTNSVNLKDIPSHISDSEILHRLYGNHVDWKHVDALKSLTDFTENTICYWLNISFKTYRAYRKPQSIFKENIKEQVLLLLSLIKHGVEVFGSMKEFENWLNLENFYFDNKSPSSFLNTVTGIKFTDDRLTAMEYGDNV